ncbi:MAG: hypothetical protein V1789_05730 [PVC group bacterium]
MNRWKFWIIAALLFISGALLGSAGTAFYVRHSVWQIMAGDSTLIHRTIMRRLTRELDLTDEQRTRAEEIIRAGQERMAIIRRETAPRVGAAIGDTVADLKKILSAEQTRELDRLVDRMSSRWKIPVGEKAALLP